MSSGDECAADLGVSETKSEFEYEYEDDDGPNGSDDERNDTVDLPPPVPLRREASHDFDVLSGEGLKKSMEEDISKAVEMFGLPFSVAGSVLRAYQWNFSRMAEAFTDNPAAALGLARCDESLLRVATDRDPTSSAASLAGSGTMTCSICLDSDVPGWKFTALSCGHAFCNDCWLNHINSKLDEGQALGIRCMDVTCWNVVDESVVVAICPKDTVKTWQRFLVNSFADENPNVRWCPRPGCEMAIRSKFGVGKGSCVPARCVCDSEFCFSCGNEVHVPIACRRYKDWQVKIDQDAASVNWILQNTKDCPKCHVPIEKNLGCNHMTCRKCFHEFCWLCLGPWSGHSACNGYATVSTDDRSSMSKYFHYFTRFQAHSHSQVLDAELRHRAGTVMAVISARAKEASSASSSALAITSTEDVTFVNTCTEALIECRKTLKWTYAAAFFMADGPEKQLFEYRQSALEAETEALSGALSKDPKVVFSTRKRIQTIAQTAQRRLTALLDGFECGFSA